MEDPNLYERLKPSERRRRENETAAALKLAPGKLDHATVVAYEVGRSAVALETAQQENDGAAKKQICSASLVSIEDLLTEQEGRVAPLAKITEIEFETVL